MEDLLWQGKRGYAQRALKINASNDISVRKTDSDEYIRARFIFRNDTAKKISKKGYVVYAITNNRIYFNEAEKNIGLKMTTNNTKCGNHYVQINNEDDALKIWDFIGDYELKFDAKRRLYYIQNSQKQFT